MLSSLWTTTEHVTVASSIEGYRPDTGPVFEVGCGTGSILVRLITTATLAGSTDCPRW